MLKPALHEEEEAHDASERQSMVVVAREMVVKNGQKVEYGISVPSKVFREYGQLHRDLLSQFTYAEHHREQLEAEAGSYFKNRTRNYDFVRRAIACVQMAAEYPKLRRPLQKLARIGHTSFYKYKDLLEAENRDLSLDSVVFRIQGSQMRYSAEDDAKFIRWLKDPKTPLRDKVTQSMIEMYNSILLSCFTETIGEW